MAARQVRPRRAPPSQLDDSGPPVFISLDPTSSTGQLSGSAQPQEAAHSQRIPEPLQQAQPAEGAAHTQRAAAQQSRKADTAKQNAPEVMPAAAEQTGRGPEPATEAFDAGAMRASLRDIYFDMVNEEQSTSSAGNPTAAKQRGRAVNAAIERSRSGSQRQQELTKYRSSSRAGAQNGQHSSALPKQRSLKSQSAAASHSASDASQSILRSKTGRASPYATGMDAEPRTEQLSKRERDRKQIEELRKDRRKASALHHHCPSPLFLASCATPEDLYGLDGRLWAAT